MDFSLPYFLNDRGSLGVFLLVSVFLAGGAAMLAGRAIAATWRPWWHVAIYMLILAAASRFIHAVLFGGNLLSLHYYLVDTAVCLGFGYLGFRLMRARQMVNQYGWINRPHGPFGWRKREHSPPMDKSDSG